MFSVMIGAGKILKNQQSFANSVKLSLKEKNGDFFKRGLAG